VFFVHYHNGKRKDSKQKRERRVGSRRSTNRKVMFSYRVVGPLRGKGNTKNVARYSCAFGSLTRQACSMPDNEDCRLPEPHPPNQDVTGTKKSRRK